MADKKVDKVILEGGLGAPIVHKDFRLYEVSIFSPTNPGNPLQLNHESVFVELNIFEDLFSNVLKGTFTFLDTQGWAEMIPLIGDETLVVSYWTPGAEGTQVETESQDLESQSSSEEITKQRFKVYDCIEVGTEERTKERRQAREQRTRQNRTQQRTEQNARQRTEHKTEKNRKEERTEHSRGQNRRKTTREKARQERTKKKNRSLKTTQRTEQKT